MRIVIPLDGSPLAELSLAPTALLANQLHPAADILLVRVAPYPLADVSLIGPYQGIGTDNLMEVARDYLQATAQLPLWQGLSVQTTLEIGGAAASICATAQREHADLIIMTSHQRTGFDKWVMGSVAEGVARDARMPVLVMRSKGDAFPDIGRFTPLTILVPLDGTPLSEAAIAPAAMLVRAFHGTLALVKILTAMPDNTNAAATAHEAYAYLTAFHDRLSSEGITVNRSLGWGEPAEQIIAKAQEHHADIVAIATHARMPLAQMIQGSVAFAVLHTLTLPILMVHPVAESSTGTEAQHDQPFVAQS